MPMARCRLPNFIWQREQRLPAMLAFFCSSTNARVFWKGAEKNSCHRTAWDLRWFREPSFIENWSCPLAPWSWSETLYLNRQFTPVKLRVILDTPCVLCPNPPTQSKVAVPKELTMCRSCALSLAPWWLTFADSPCKPSTHLRLKNIPCFKFWDLTWQYPGVASWLVNFGGPNPRINGWNLLKAPSKQLPPIALTPFEWCLLDLLWFHTIQWNFIPSCVLPPKTILPRTPIWSTAILATKMQNASPWHRAKRHRSRHTQSEVIEGLWVYARFRFFLWERAQPWQLENISLMSSHQHVEPHFHTSPNKWNG